MVAMEPVSSSFAGQVLGLVDSRASFNFMSHELCMKLGWMVDKHQPGFSTIGEWNSGDKRGTGNRSTVGRSLAEG